MNVEAPTATRGSSAHVLGCRRCTGRCGRCQGHRKLTLSNSLDLYRSPTSVSRVTPPILNLLYSSSAECVVLSFRGLRIRHRPRALSQQFFLATPVFLAAASRSLLSIPSGSRRLSIARAQPLPETPVSMASSSNTPAPAPVSGGDDHPELVEELTKLFQDFKVDQEDHELIDSLKALSKKSPKLVKSSEYQAPADPSIFVRSWKMNEFKYYDVPSPFPTLARGLFTQDIKNSSGKMRHRIVARGYDKFFNIGEVPWTTVSAHLV